MPRPVEVTTPSDREIVVRRSFDAPRALVWETMVRPDLTRRWVFGPPGWEMTACENDARVGGTFRWEWRKSSGESMSMTGVHLEMDPPRRCVRTEVFAMGDLPAMGEQRATLVLAEAGGRTDLTITLAYDSREARDGALGSGMDRGMAASYDRLDGVLAEAVGSEAAR